MNLLAPSFFPEKNRCLTKATNAGIERSARQISWSEALPLSFVHVLRKHQHTHTSPQQDGVQLRRTRIQRGGGVWQLIYRRCSAGSGARITRQRSDKVRGSSGRRDDHRAFPGLARRSEFRGRCGDTFAARLRSHTYDIFRQQIERQSRLRRRRRSVGRSLQFRSGDARRQTQPPPMAARWSEFRERCGDTVAARLRLYTYDSFRQQIGRRPRLRWRRRSVRNSLQFRSGDACLESLRC